MSKKTIKEALEYASDQIGKEPMGDAMAKMMIEQVLINLEDLGVADNEIEFS